MTNAELKELQEVKEMVDKVTNRLIEVGMFPNADSIREFQKEFIDIYNRTRGLEKGWATFYVMVDLLDETCDISTYTKSTMIDALCELMDRGQRLVNVPKNVARDRNKKKRK